MTDLEIKKLIGAATWKRMKVFASKAKTTGLSPAEVKKALKAKFGKHLKIVDSALIITRITRPPVP